MFILELIRDAPFMVKLIRKGSFNLLFSHSVSLLKQPKPELPLLLNPQISINTVLTIHPKSVQLSIEMRPFCKLKLVTQMRISVQLSKPVQLETGTELADRYGQGILIFLFCEGNALGMVAPVDHQFVRLIYHFKLFRKPELVVRVVVEVVEILRSEPGILLAEILDVLKDCFMLW